jgi:Holliday junction resolvasome RuvABC endonuclease subunit
MNILALDLGTRTGYALLKDEHISIGTKKLLNNKSASGARFLDFYRWLIETIERHHIYMVFFERVYGHSGTEAAHIYGAFMYVLAMVCEERKIECRGISVGTIKKFATGKGNATKEEMIMAAKSQGFNPQTDDEADALAILLLALKINNLSGICRGSGSSSPLAEGGRRHPEALLAPEAFARLTPPMPEAQG